MERGEQDERFMREALAEARAAAEEGEVPIGAVVVHEGEVIARAHNRRELDDDPSAHAEFLAMTAAARALGRWRLTGCTVYVTLEPCLMCAGLMVNARVDRCVYGAADPKGGALGSLYRLHDDARLNHRFAVTAGVLADACAGVLSDFFANLRAGARADGDAHEAKRAAALRDGAGARAACCEDAPCAATPAPAPRVLLAIDSFKGSAMSAEVEAWAAEGIRHACPGARVTALPMADGGEGTVEALHRALGGAIVTRRVAGPLDEQVDASYLLADGADGPVAAIEMAEAAGIEYSPCTHEAALHASTYGVGELLLDAVARGARRAYFAIGGSATNDGGAGFLQALGARLLDAHGEEIAPGLAGLRDVARVDLSAALAALQGCELVVLSDVDNPLVGARGAVRMYGPQKGLLEGCVDEAGAEERLVACDRWMVGYGRALDAARTAAGVPAGEGRPRFRSVLGVPGAGAAGGLGAALLVLGARMTSGASAVLDLIGFDAALAEADLLITGEGFMDEQTAHGKAPVGAAARAHRRGVPTIALVGGRADVLDDVYAAGIGLVLPIVRRPMALDRALSATRRARTCAPPARPPSGRTCWDRRGDLAAGGNLPLDARRPNGYHRHYALRVRWVRVTICSESGQVREEAAIRSLCRAPGSIECTGRFFMSGLRAVPRPPAAGAPAARPANPASTPRPRSAAGGPAAPARSRRARRYPRQPLRRRIFNAYVIDA